MFKENQNRKAVSLTDLRSNELASISENGEPSSAVTEDEMIGFGLGHSSQPQSTTTMNTLGVHSYDTSWVVSHQPIGMNSGIEMFPFHLEHRRHISTTPSFRDRRRIAFGNRGDASNRLRSIHKKSQPYMIGPATRRKSFNELRLPSLHRGVPKFTRALRRGNCIYIGKAASLALENGDFDDFMSMPSSSSSSSDSPCLVTSPPRCSLYNPLNRRRHSLYAKVYSSGHRIVPVVEEDNPRSVVERLDLDRSASCVESSNHQMLVPTGSLSVDLSTPQFESTLNRFNSLCISMKSGEMGFQRPEQYNSAADSLCSNFSNMMLPSSSAQQSYSTGHSPFSSPNPLETTTSSSNISSWTMPSHSAQDLLTPLANDHQGSVTNFFNHSPTSSATPTYFSPCLKN